MCMYVPILALLYCTHPLICISLHCTCTCSTQAYVTVTNVYVLVQLRELYLTSIKFNYILSIKNNSKPHVHYVLL